MRVSGLGNKIPVSESVPEETNYLRGQSEGCPSIVYLCEVSGSDLYVCADQWGQWDRKGICG